MSERVERYVEAMGPDLGPAFVTLSDNLAMLHAKWAEYVELFGSGEERVQLANRSAGWFFHVVQRTLLDDVVLGLARLTDAPETGGKKNLSLRMLPGLLPDEAIASEVDGLVEDAVLKTGFAREHRNKRIAHLDLAHALTRGATPLPATTQEAVRDALEALAKCLNRVDGHYCDTTMFYDFGPVSLRGARALLNRLMAGEVKRNEIVEARRSWKGPGLPPRFPKVE